MENYWNENWTFKYIQTNRTYQRMVDRACRLSVIRSFHYVYIPDTSEIGLLVSEEEEEEE